MLTDDPWTIFAKGAVIDSIIELIRAVRTLEDPYTSKSQSANTKTYFKVQFPELDTPARKFVDMTKVRTSVWVKSR